VQRDGICLKCLPPAAEGGLDPELAVRAQADWHRIATKRVLWGCLAVDCSKWPVDRIR